MTKRNNLFLGQTENGFMFRDSDSEYVTEFGILYLEKNFFDGSQRIDSFLKNYWLEVFTKI